jgi:hypothetical protein
MGKGHFHFSREKNMIFTACSEAYPATEPRTAGNCN